MILSSCHDYSLNNDCHCRCDCHCHYMQRIYAYLIMSCFALPCFVLSWVDQYYYCYYRHDVVWARLTLHYHILCFFILSLLLIWSPFYSILFYFISNWFTILFSIVSHINEWFVSICLSVCLSLCPSIRLFVYLYE